MKQSSQSLMLSARKIPAPLLKLLRQLPLSHWTLNGQPCIRIKLQKRCKILLRQHFQNSVSSIFTLNFASDYQLHLFQRPSLLSLPSIQVALPMRQLLMLSRLLWRIHSGHLLITCVEETVVQQRFKSNSSTFLVNSRKSKITRMSHLLKWKQDGEMG